MPWQFIPINGVRSFETCLATSQGLGLILQTLDSVSVLGDMRALMTRRMSGHSRRIEIRSLKRILDVSETLGSMVTLCEKGQQLQHLSIIL